MDFTPIIAQALEATLGVNPKHLHSIIIFVGSVFKTEVPANVSQGIGFIRYIKSFQQVFNDSMLHALQTGRRAPTLATREHVQNLKRRSDPTAKRQCPSLPMTSLLSRSCATWPPTVGYITAWATRELWYFSGVGYNSLLK